MQSRTEKACACTVKRVWEEGRESKKVVSFEKAGMASCALLPSLQAVVLGGFVLHLGRCCPSRDDSAQTNLAAQKLACKLLKRC